MAMLCALVTASAQALTVQAAGAQAAPGTRPVPPLVSELLRPAVPPIPAGDFRNRPDPSPDRPLPAPKASFDPARSTPLDDKTTPTRRTWRNPDGSFTVEVSARPVRYRDATGAWKDLNLELSPGTGGALAAKAAPSAARLAPSASASGDLATVTTPAGTVALRHPDAQAAPAAVAGAAATYAKALPGGRDVVVELTPDGFKETVVLPNAAAGAAYTEQFVLPAGTSARQGPAGVELLDASGRVFASYGGGVATDATFARTGPLVATGVSVRLVGVQAGLATVEVGVDPAWLSAPARAFPVRIDPLFSQTTAAASTLDSFVSNPDSYSSSPSTHPWLVAGNDGSTLLRSLLRFDLSSLPAPGPRVVVSEAHLRVLNWYTYGYSCTQGTVSLYGLGGGFDASTRWGTQPSLSPTDPVSWKPFAHNNNAGSQCPQDYENLDATALARSWLNGTAPNHGLSLRAGGPATAETLTSNFKAFYSAEGTPAGHTPPTLSITYNNLPAVATPAGPADGVTLASPTPTLSANAVTDPDGQAVQYWFRVGTGPNVEGGHDIDSGWLTGTPPNTPCAAGQICWSVPKGALRDGIYRWHVFTWDGVAEGYFTPPGPNDQSSFRSALRLGDGGPAPADDYGGLRANLATGNVVFSHAGPSFPAVGGDAGVTLTYNSRTPSTGAVAGYYDDPTASRDFANKTPVMVRNDPSIAFSWGADTAPGPGLGTDNYLVRWAAALVPPATGSYTFYAGTTDGIRVFVNNVKVLERWSDPGGAVNDTISGTAVPLSKDQAVPIVVEYFEGGGVAQVALAAYGPAPGGGTKAMMVEPSWLRADPGAMPAGWTLGTTPALAYVSARSFEHGVTLSDAAGGLHTYAWTGSGYAPPPGEDGVLARNPDNTMTLLGDDGVAYFFDTLGQLTSATARDDEAAASGANSAGINYAFSTAADRPRRLLELRDPVGARVVRLHYGNFPSDDPNLPDKYRCPNTPAGFANPPDNQLCQVEYWDGSSTFLRYNAAAQLVRIEEPGGARWDLAYDGEGRLAKVRDPLAADAIGAPPNVIPRVPDDDRSRTLVGYDGDGRVSSISLPVPNAGQASELPRPGHTYEYPSATETRVRVDGLRGATDEPNGYNRKVTFDAGGRALTDADATAKTTTMVWDAGDRLLSTTDPANRRSSTIYDGDANRAQPTGRVSHTYGPAPASCFNAAGTPNGSCSVPPPHTAIDYDTVSAAPATGLAMVAWANAGYSGPPKLRDLAPVSGGSVVAGTPSGLPAGSWSARYTGEITLGTGIYRFGVTATGGSARLLVDDKVLADSSGTNIALNIDTAARHRIRVDFTATGASPSLSLSWTPPGASSQALPASALAPRYANPTRTTTDDDSGVPARVTTAVYVSLPWGLIKEEIVDPGAAPHLNLVTTTGHEPGVLRRPVSRTLPAGDPLNANTGTEYAYYGDTQGGPAACGQAAGVNQGGRLRTTTAPSPDGTANGRRVTEVVYDAAGRVKASRVVGDQDWSCSSYDARGRLTQSTVPDFEGEDDHTESGHIFDYNYAVGGNPLVRKVTEGTAGITTTVDLLGRVVTYTDVWNKTTASTYDQAGRRTQSAGPAGTIAGTYDPAGRIDTQSLDGALMADAAYDAAGELASVSYAAALNGGNGSALFSITRHPTGMVTGLTWTGAGGTALAADAVTRSRSGKVVDQSIDGTDPYPAGRNFLYDAAGRLITARVPNRSIDYGFATSGGCGTQTAPGRNTNRSSVTIDGGSPTTYCYDRADRLTSSSDAAVGTPVYDSHGNTTKLGNQTLFYDNADRHMETKVNGSTLVRYERDPTGRIVSRKEGDNPAVHYGYSGPGDSPAFVMDADNNLPPLERTIGLVGGVLVTKRGGLLGVGDVWSYPNVHGDVMATADNAGVKQGSTKTYDPDGQALAGLPDNSAGNFDYGWLGQHQRPIEHAGTLATIEMGARQYVPGLGRFLEVDPVEGGCANDYVYVFGDPMNEADPSGRGVCESRVTRFLINFGSLAQWITDPAPQAAQEVGWAVLQEQAEKLDAWRAKHISKRVIPIFSQSVARANSLTTAIGTFLDLACMKSRQNDKYKKYFDGAYPQGTYSSGGISPYMNSAGVPISPNGF